MASVTKKNAIAHEWTSLEEVVSHIIAGSSGYVARAHESTPECGYRCSTRVHELDPLCGTISESEVVLEGKTRVRLSDLDVSGGSEYLHQ